MAGIQNSSKFAYKAKESTLLSFTQRVLIVLPGLILFAFLLAACGTDTQPASQAPVVAPPSTATLTPVPEPTATTAPEATPTLTPAPIPTETPAPEATPEPTQTPAPEVTPEPTQAPTPEATAVPTEAPTPEATPEPTQASAGEGKVLFDVSSTAPVLLGPLGL